MKNISEKLKQLRVNSKCTLREFGKKIGVTHSSVSQWERGFSEPKTKHLLSISNAFDVSLEWLTDGVLVSVDKNCERDELGCTVPFYSELSVAGGTGAVNVEHCEQDLVVIPRYVLGNRKINNVVCVKVSGDSMFPVLPNNTVIAIDKADKKIVDGKVYVFRTGDLVRVKLLVNQPTGMLIKSYNDFYSDEFISINEVVPAKLDLIGRVFWASLEI